MNRYSWFRSPGPASTPRGRVRKALGGVSTKKVDRRPGYARDGWVSVAGLKSELASWRKIPPATQHRRVTSAVRQREDALGVRGEECNGSDQS